MKCCRSVLVAIVNELLAAAQGGLGASSKPATVILIGVAVVAGSETGTGVESETRTSRFMPLSSSSALHSSSLKKLRTEGQQNSVATALAMLVLMLN